jgi:hypothetical protein
MPMPGTSKVADLNLLARGQNIEFYEKELDRHKQRLKDLPETFKAQAKPWGGSLNGRDYEEQSKW